MKVLITGCSTGFGRAAAVELTKRGHDVIATAPARQHRGPRRRRSPRARRDGRRLGQAATRQETQRS
jgi:NAD(P)-dependent dehydrogenase (short-subunit alcohol dehydrogenase family)